MQLTVEGGGMWMDVCCGAHLLPDDRGLLAEEDVTEGRRRFLELWGNIVGMLIPVSLAVTIVLT